MTIAARLSKEHGVISHLSIHSRENHQSKLEGKSHLQKRGLSYVFVCKSCMVVILLSKLIRIFLKKVM